MCSSPNSLQNLLHLFIDLGTALSEHDPTINSIISHEIKTVICNTKPSKITENQISKNLNKKIKNQNLIITKADKGNSVVILPKSDYLDKANKFILSSYSSVLDKDPTNMFQKTLNQLLRNSLITI